MTKADLIDEVSRLAELTRKDSEVIVETIFESVVRSLRAGDKIEIRGFGSFRTRQRKPRVGRNPKTGDRVEVPAKKIPFFKPSKELKDMVNSYVERTAPSRASEQQGKLARRHYVAKLAQPRGLGLCRFSGRIYSALIPITAIIRPVLPNSARCEKKRAVRTRCSPRSTLMCSSRIPASCS